MGWAGWGYLSHCSFVPEKIKPPGKQPLIEKLGSDTTEAIFKYIGNKTERSVEATIKTLATKDDIANVKNDIAEVKYELSNKIANSIRWSFVFWIGQAATTLGFCG